MDQNPTRRLTLLNCAGFWAIKTQMGALIKIRAVPLTWG